MPDPTPDNVITPTGDRLGKKFMERDQLLLTSKGSFSHNIFHYIKKLYTPSFLIFLLCVRTNVYAGLELAGFVMDLTQYQLIKFSSDCLAKHIRWS